MFCESMLALHELVGKVLSKTTKTEEEKTHLTNKNFSKCKAIGNLQFTLFYFSYYTIVKDMKWKIVWSSGYHNNTSLQSLNYFFRTLSNFADKFDSFTSLFHFFEQGCQWTRLPQTRLKFQQQPRIPRAIKAASTPSTKAGSGSSTQEAK